MIYTSEEQSTAHTLCMECCKKKATKVYHLKNRGYGSSFDGMSTLFQVCDDCDDSRYAEWFNEEPSKHRLDKHIECYKHEKELLKKIESLPLDSQYLFYWVFDSRKPLKLSKEEYLALRES